MVQHFEGFGGADMELSIPAVADRARARRKATYVPDDPLLTAAEAAAERSQALSTFWRDVRAGRVPPAYYVSPRCPRWRRSELREALLACRAPARIAV
jgi:predicted DNA-binding transcriptional regulator AlpA